MLRPMNEPSFLFYDLETTGLSKPYDRVMQFGAQRTNMDLEPIGDPFNLIVALTNEILPSPKAILTTGITPQFSQREGMSEAEFVKIIQTQAFTPGTIAVGFNTLRFDDAFMQYTFYRNFYDPYEWGWKDGRSRWDLLDVVRMMRALRPSDIKWPSEDGKAVTKLELITKLNGITHDQAHDAMSDVYASIELARLLRDKNPKLFNYLLNIRDKKKAAEVIDLSNPQPFVYTSGSFGPNYNFTSVCLPFGVPDKNGKILAYDLRYDPEEYANYSESELKEILQTPWEEKQKSTFIPFPAKAIALNKCPAVAPLAVLKHEDQERIQLDIDTVKRHLEAFKISPLQQKLSAVLRANEYDKSEDVEGALYENFFEGADKMTIATVRNATATTISSLKPRFIDQRLPELFMRYKARNFPESLSEEESKAWEDYRARRIVRDLPEFEQNMLAESQTHDAKSLSMLEDLKLWAQTIMPGVD